MRIPTEILGPLERQIMDVIWESDKCSVRCVVRALPCKRAYTTVMTTLDRMYQKRILNRKMIDGKFLYSARLGRQELEKKVAHGLITTVLANSTNSRELTVLSLLEAIRRHDGRLFNERVAIMTRIK